MWLKAWLRRHRRVAAEVVVIFVVALVPRLIGLGDFLTADEKNWVGRGVEFVRATREFRFNDTLQTTHPGIPTLWISGLTSAAYTRATGTEFSFDHIREFVTASQYPIVVLNSLLVAGISLTARLILPFPIAGLAALVVALDPFFVAYSKVVHVDALLTGFLMCALLLFLHAERTESLVTLTLSALASALAILSKIPALVLIPFVLLVLTTRPGALATPERMRRLRLFGQWLVIVGVTILVLWPGLLWVPDPLGNVKTVKRDLVVAISTPHHMADDYTIQPWRYPATLLTRTTVPTFIGFLLFLLFLVNATERSRRSSIPLLFANSVAQTADDAPRENRGPAGSVPSPAGRGATSGQGSEAPKGRGERGATRSEDATLGHPSGPTGGWAELQAGPSLDLRTLWLLVAFIPLFLLLMMLGAKKGDRYILPIFPIIDVLATLGVVAAIGWLRPRWSTKSVLGVSAAVLLFPLLFHLARLGPYTLAYFNPLFPPEVSQELGWGEGLDQVARFLNALDDGGRVVAASWYPEELRALVDRPVLHLNSHEQLPVGYVVLYRNMFGRPPDHPANDFIDEYYRKKQPVFTAIVNGLPYAWVYERPAYTGITGELLPGTAVVSELLADDASLAAVEVFVATYSGRAQSGRLVLQIFDQAGALVRAAERPVRDIGDNTWTRFTFPPLPKGSYVALVTTVETRPKDAPTVRIAPKERGEPRFWVSRDSDSLTEILRRPPGRGLVGIRLVSSPGAP